jgi:hypothetical protein
LGEVGHDCEELGGLTFEEVASRLSLRRLDPGGTGGRHEDSAVAVVPAHTEPGRLRGEHFFDYSGTGGLADLFGLDDDPVSDLSLHRDLLQHFADSSRLSLDLDPD